MANRRMFSLDVVDTDAFIDMPCSARLLYYDLGMRADDDGFLQSVQKIMRFTGASKDDVNVLISRGFLIPFESGVIVIRHWRQNNEIKKDRYKATTCIDEKAQITLDSAKRYMRLQHGTSMEPNCIQHGTSMEAQIRLGKDSIDKSSREGASTTVADLFDQIEAHQRADDLIRRYRLPDSDPTREALLEDAEGVGFDRLEEVLKQASLSNNRQGLSVNFYRTVLNGSGKQKEANIYAGYRQL